MSLLSRAPALALICVLAATALAGCGGGGDDDKSSDARADYIRAADRICGDAGKIGAAMSQSVQEALTQGNVAGAAQAINQFQPTFRKHLDRLAALPAPQGQEAKAKEVVAALNSTADDVASEARALQNNDQKLLDEVIASLRSKQARAQKLAKAYGFKVCGSA
jgi:hypothetical protein